MDLFKSQLERVRRQLAALNATQKMLTASLVAIIVITILWWGKYASEAEMVPLLKQSFSTSDLGQIEEWLRDNDITYVSSGDKIMVPTEKRMEVLSRLTFAGKLPHNTQEGFDDIVKTMSPFDAESKENRLFSHAKDVVLSRIIGGFKNVTQADVMTDATSFSRIGQDSVEPSATVNIVMREGVAIDPKMVDAAADLVVGAQAGLKKKNVKVVVNGLAQKVADASDESMPGGQDQLALMQQYEADDERRVRQAFGDIPGLLVSVKVALNTTTTQKETQEFDGSKAVQKALQETNETDETSGASPAPAEAGTLANTQVSVASAPSANQSQTHEKSEVKYQVNVPTTRTVSKTPPGDYKALGATVRVPFSYFVQNFRVRNKSVSDPQYDQVRPLIDQMLPEMQKQACTALDVPSLDKVIVVPYIDPAPAPMAMSGTASGSSTVSRLVGRHAREMALGGLALMSLFMASMMVRKGAPPVIPSSSPPATPLAGPAPVLTAGEPLAGEAASTDPALDGMELNEEAVRAQQMVDQVSTMVRENPDGAAALVKRWLNRS